MGNTIVLILSLLALGLGLGFVLWDMHRRSLRTRILQLPGGLRFEAQNFSVEVRRSEQEVRTQCVQGLLSAPAGAASAQPAEARRVQHTFAAVGFSANVRACMKPGTDVAQPRSTGCSDIVLQGADGTQLRIAQVNATVATSFKYFYLQVRLWIDKLEQRLERERVERLRGEAEAAQAQQEAELMAQLLAGKAAQQDLTSADCEAMAAAQIAHWRQSAGFEGQHSLQQTDANGVVQWFVDLTMDGRITLHADKRTIHASLRGSSIESKSGLLEIGVRDAYWSESDPELRTFRVFKGVGADERRAWKERMEILRKSLADPG